MKTTKIKTSNTNSQILVSLILIMVLSSFLIGANSCPIILVHGFFGWGPDEAGEYNYWGGHIDLVEFLTEAGYEVYPVSIGPISSNWDRAVELFYQVKGGQVDYGESHSQKFNLVRFPPGKTYPGIYPQWDADHPIHIIGHSMGGQTSRQLEYLLQNRWELETSALLGESVDGWIFSITTLSTPHNGTTLVPILDDMLTLFDNLLPYIIGFHENSIWEDIFDYDLEQWGLGRLPDEKFHDYIKRLDDSAVGHSSNLCAWDLSLDGARELNSVYLSDPSTYYFSYSTSATRRDDRTGYHLPDDKMAWRLWANGFRMGRYSGADSTWYENDGVVNTNSMIAPTTGDRGPEPWHIYTGTPVPGIWQYMGNLHMCHLAVIGHELFTRDTSAQEQLFLHHCNLLYQLDPVVRNP